MLHGYCPPERYLPYLSWTQIANLPDKPNTVIVLPAGSTEQHGPHLPCAVDTIIAAGVMGHALARLPAARPAPGRRATSATAASSVTRCRRRRSRAPTS